MEIVLEFQILEPHFWNLNIAAEIWRRNFES